jgi:hypothetical protein
MAYEYRRVSCVFNHRTQFFDEAVRCAGVSGKRAPCKSWAVVGAHAGELPELVLNGAPAYAGGSNASFEDDGPPVSLAVEMEPADQTSGRWKPSPVRPGAKELVEDPASQNREESQRNRHNSSVPQASRVTRNCIPEYRGGQEERQTAGTSPAAGRQVFF